MSDYVGLVCIRALSRDIRRLLYCALLRCSGIHLDESALMTELRRDGVHPDNYCSSLIKQTTSRDLCHALSHSIISLFLSLVFFFLHLLSFQFLGLFPFTFPPPHLPYSFPLLLFNSRLPLAIIVIEIPAIPSVVGNESAR